MELVLGIKIEKILSRVKAVDDRPDNILGFGELFFYEEGNEAPIIKIKGFTIRKKQFGEKKVITVVFPAYKTGIKYQTSFILENKSLWSDVTKLLLQDYYAQVGDGAPANEYTEVDVNPEDVPF